MLADEIIRVKLESQHVESGMNIFRQGLAGPLFQQDPSLRWPGCSVPNSQDVVANFGVKDDEVEAGEGPEETTVQHKD